MQERLQEACKGQAAQCFSLMEVSVFPYPPPFLSQKKKNYKKKKTELSSLLPYMGGNQTHVSIGPKLYHRTNPNPSEST